MGLNLLQCFAFGLWDKEDCKDDIQGTEDREHPERSRTGYEILWKSSLTITISKTATHFFSGRPLKSRITLD